VSPELARALSAYTKRDLSEWVSLGALPEGMPLAEVAAALGADPETYVRWFLGDPPREAFWCPATIDGYDRVKIWFREGVVLKLEGEWPELSPGAGEALGPPEMQLDYSLDTMVVPRGEHVWASLGVALKLDPEGNLAAGLTGFSPTTLTAYGEALRDADEYRESPPRRGRE
jgi:hypothetical protein